MIKQRADIHVAINHTEHKIMFS